MSRDVKVFAPVALGARNLLRNLRTPMLVAASLAQPVIWLVLFSQIFGAWSAPPHSSAWATSPTWRSSPRA